MAYSFEISGSFLVVRDYATGVLEFRESRKNLSFEEPTLSSVIIKYDPSSTTRIINNTSKKWEYLFSEVVDSSGSPFASFSDFTDFLDANLGVTVMETYPCADVTYVVEYDNGDPIESGTEPSGGSILVQVPTPLYWELNFNGTDDVIFVPATANNEGVFASGTGSNVGTVTVSTDGITYIAIVYPLTVTAGTTYYFKRSTAAVTGVFTLTGTYA